MTKLWVPALPEGKESENRLKDLIREIAESYPNSEKGRDSTVQEAHKTPNTNDGKISSRQHVTLKREGICSHYSNKANDATYS